VGLGSRLPVACNAGCRWLRREQESTVVQDDVSIITLLRGLELTFHTYTQIHAFARTHKPTSTHKFTHPHARTHTYTHLRTSYNTNSDSCRDACLCIPISHTNAPPRIHRRLIDTLQGTLDSLCHTEGAQVGCQRWQWLLPLNGLLHKVKAEALQLLQHLSRVHPIDAPCGFGWPALVKWLVFVAVCSYKTSECN